MSWSDLWTFYKGCGSESIRKQILIQISLEEFLPHQSHRVQTEILEHAPMDVVTRFLSLLSEKARKALGVTNMISSDDLEQMNRMFK